jgi:hypothetical protein
MKACTNLHETRLAINSIALESLRNFSPIGTLLVRKAWELGNIAIFMVKSLGAIGPLFCQKKRTSGSVVHANRRRTGASWISECVGLALTDVAQSCETRRM